MILIIDNMIYAFTFASVVTFCIGVISLFKATMQTNVIFRWAYIFGSLSLIVPGFERSLGNVLERTLVLMPVYFWFSYVYERSTRKHNRFTFAGLLISLFIATCVLITDPEITLSDIIVFVSIIFVLVYPASWIGRGVYDLFHPKPKQLEEKPDIAETQSSLDSNNELEVDYGLDDKLMSLRHNLLKNATKETKVVLKKYKLPGFKQLESFPIYFDGIPYKVIGDGNPVLMRFHVIDGEQIPLQNKSLVKEIYSRYFYISLAKKIMDGSLQAIELSDRVIDDDTWGKTTAEFIKNIEEDSKILSILNQLHEFAKDNQLLIKRMEDVKRSLLPVAAKTSLSDEDFMKFKQVFDNFFEYYIERIDFLITHQERFNKLLKYEEDLDPNLLNRIYEAIDEAEFYNSEIYLFMKQPMSKEYMVYPNLMLEKVFDGNWLASYDNDELKPIIWELFGTRLTVFITIISWFLLFPFSIWLVVTDKIHALVFLSLIIVFTLFIVLSFTVTEKISSKFLFNYIKKTNNGEWKEPLLFNGEAKNVAFKPTGLWLALLLTFSFTVYPYIRDVELDRELLLYLLTLIWAGYIYFAFIHPKKENQWRPFLLYPSGLWFDTKELVKRSVKLVHFSSNEKIKLEFFLNGKKHMYLLTFRNHHEYNKAKDALVTWAKDNNIQVGESK